MNITPMDNFLIFQQIIKGYGATNYLIVILSLNNL